MNSDREGPKALKEPAVTPHATNPISPELKAWLDHVILPILRQELRSARSEVDSSEEAA